MRLTRLIHPALPAILASLIPLCVSLYAQDPEPTCDGCGAQAAGGVIYHFPGCPYEVWTEDPDEPDADLDWEVEPWIPVPPPESKFDREKRELLNRLKGHAPSTSSFQDRNRNLLSRMRSGPPTEVPSAKERLKAASLKNAYHEDPAVAAAAGELALKTPAAVAEAKKAIDRRLSAPNPEIQAAIRSIKVKAPPKLIGRFDNLLVGDVLLVRSDDSKLSSAYWERLLIRGLDNAMTGTLRSRAYHTFLFVKEVNGIKLFLDNMPGQGTRIKTELQIRAEYGSQEFDLARPVRKPDAADLWKAASEAGIKSIKSAFERKDNLVDNTDYGIIGDEDMVCSETSRWALIQAKSIIADGTAASKPAIDGSTPTDKTESPETRSALKRMVIKFGPADFYLDTDNFFVFPLEILTPAPSKATQPK